MSISSPARNFFLTRIKDKRYMRAGITCASWTHPTHKLTDESSIQVSYGKQTAFLALDLPSLSGFNLKCLSSPPIFNLNNKNVYEKGIVRDPEGQYTPTTPTSMHWVGCVTVQIRKWVRRGHHTPLRSAPKIYHIFYLNLF